MANALVPMLFGVLVWWLSTGLALWVVGLAGRRPHGAAAGTCLGFAVSLGLLAWSASDASPAGAYLAFTAAIAVWGTHEVAFLAGWITGPWRAPCPAGASRLARTGYAIAAIPWHELALVAAGAAILAVTWNGPNQAGPWTFLVLFAMRISAKLNVFLGVPNLTESFLPAHLAYLKSFFGQRPMNALFPISITLATAALFAAAGEASAALDPGRSAAWSLVATLVGLGLLEHWFLVLPLPVEALWSWGLAGRDDAAGGRAPDASDPDPETVSRLDMRLARVPAGGLKAPCLAVPD